LLESKPIYPFFPELAEYMDIGKNLVFMASFLWNRGVRYHEPEYWKFGEVGNRYFRHATGQLYALSKDLATYISTNK
jgi:hypothetical protein